ncbi:MAG: hypothetical protein WC061_05670 [Melioribacteraceae bacterium]
MDNLFQLLIFLFVIYTIINSVFGKKKAPKIERKIPSENEGEADGNASPRSEKSSEEILQELFGFKIPKTGNDYPRPLETEYNSNPEYDLPKIENQSVESAVLPELDYDNLPSLEAGQTNLLLNEYHNAYEVKNESNKKTSDLLAKIRDPKTLRELILFSEILNKPKSLRR